jgi:hypothetical protein
MGAPGPGPIVSRVVRFFRRHPVLLLFALTPGIPEYLSGSTAVYPVVTSPLAFLLFLGLNLGLYGPGVLLVREAWVRWGQSWGSLLLLGAAYGLLEEGTALSTLFNPNASVVSSLGHYGRSAGVNWVWLLGVLGVHIVLSVALPIVLLGLALPETRGRSLLSRRETVVAAVVYVLDLSLLAVISHYWTVQLAWILGAAGVAIALWVVAFYLPKGCLDPPTEYPRYGPRAFFGFGLAFFPVLLLVPALGEALGLPAPVTFVVDLALSVALLLLVQRNIGKARNEPHLVLLAFGATLPIAVFGFVAQARIPVVLVVDLVYGLFFYTLWRHYRPIPVPWVGATRAS